MKRKFFLLHKYIGMITGLVIFIVSITGCLWVFEDEIKNLTDDEIFIKAESRDQISATDAKRIAQTIFPDKHVHGTLYKKLNDPVEVILYEPEPEFYQSVFLHPYNGEVLKVEDHLTGFFAFVLDGHMTLWLPEKIGSHIVSFSVFIFMIVLVSGLVLWWPKSKNKKQRFTFKWKNSTRWKRKNFDLHSIVGFYICFLAFILAFTGSVMAYDWFYYVVYKSAGGTKAPQFIIPDNISGSANDSVSAANLDRIIPELRKSNPNAASFEVHYPYTDSSSIYVEISNTEGVYYNSDYRFFDANTLEEISSNSIYGKYEEADFSDKVIRMNYDIHVGAIGGMAGKIIMFLVSLLIATLPITGYLMWWGRRKY